LVLLQSLQNGGSFFFWYLIISGTNTVKARAPTAYKCWVIRPDASNCNTRSSI
jgi:hypothetical protein